MKNPPRIGQDGLPQEDWEVNPKYLERLKSEEAEKKRLEEEAASPWTRERVIAAVVAARTSAPKDPLPDGIYIGGQANLHGADLSDLDLSGLNLSDANLHGAKLVRANLSGSNLSRANLSGADLSFSNMTGADLWKANASGACFCGADVSKSRLHRINLSGSCVEGSLGLDLETKPLTQADLDLSGSVIGGKKIMTQVDQGVSTRVGPQLDEANLKDLSLKCTRKVQ